MHTPARAHTHTHTHTHTHKHTHTHTYTHTHTHTQAAMGLHDLSYWLALHVYYTAIAFLQGTYS